MALSLCPLPVPTSRWVRGNRLPRATQGGRDDEKARLREERGVQLAAVHRHVVRFHGVLTCSSVTAKPHFPLLRINEGSASLQMNHCVYGIALSRCYLFYSVDTLRCSLGATYYDWIDAVLIVVESGCLEHMRHTYTVKMCCYLWKPFVV